jgi:branched-chain amino acid transport system substrate-binding protein
MKDSLPISRRTFNRVLAAAGGGALLGPVRFARAATTTKLKAGVLLPRSGVQALIGQSCDRAAILAPEVIKGLLGVELEIMSADTESNAETARTRAERLIDEGANVLIGAFDSGHTAAIAQVAEQRGVPFVINIAGAPQITEQGYKFVFRNFPPAPELTKNGLALINDVFQTANVKPKTAVFMYVNDTFGQAMSKGITALMPALKLPFSVVETISYDVAAKDLSVEVSKAKAAKADFLLLVCRLNDAILLRREMVKQRWAPMGVISPGSPGLYEEQYAKSLGKHANYAISNTVWYNPKNAITQTLIGAFKKRYPKDEFAFHGTNVAYTFDALMIAADAFKRAGGAGKPFVEAIRTTDIPADKRVSLGGAIKFNAKGQVENNRSASIQNLDGKPTITLPSDLAQGKLVFPAPEYKA